MTPDHCPLDSTSLHTPTKFKNKLENNFRGKQFDRVMRAESASGGNARFGMDQMIRHESRRQESQLFHHKLSDFEHDP